MAQKQDIRTQLLTASPFQLMLSLSVPAIIGMVVVGLYNFMDRVFVGQLINEVAMGAVSVSYPFTLINTGVSTLIGVGSASVLSRAIGKKDQNTVDKIMGNLIAMNLLLGVIITALGMIFTRQLLTLSGAEGEILNHAERYLHIIFAGSLFVNFAQSANMIMRGEGILKKAMLITGTGAVLNIILDPIMITAMSAQGKGIEGAAYATVVSQIVTAAITLWYFLTKSKVVRIHRVRLESSLISEILGVGFSAMLMQVMTMVQQTTLYHVAARHGGDTWQIILGAALSIQSFTMIPLWGAGQGFQPAAGTNYGAKQYDRVKQVTRAFMVGVTVLSLIFYIPIQLAPKTILSWFIKDAGIVSQGVTDFRILFSTYIVLGFVLMVITLMQSLGKASKAIIIIVDSNLQREQVLPSEKAFAYKMKLDAMKRQAGRPSKNNSVPVAQNFGGKTSRQILGEQVGESQDQIRRYIRLTNLIPEIIDMVDNSVLKEKGQLQMALRPAVELSYLTEAEQKDLLETMTVEDCTPSHAQAIKMRDFSEKGKLNADVILSIMQEEKPNQVEQFKIPRNRIDKFFPAGTPAQKIEDTIVKALEMYRKRERARER